MMIILSIPNKIKKKYGCLHDDVIKWKYFPRYCHFGRVIHQSPVDSPCKDQWWGALMFSSICAWTNVSASNQEAGDLRRHGAHYDVTVICIDAYTMTLWYGITSRGQSFDIFFTVSLSNLLNKHSSCRGFETRLSLNWFHERFMRS